MYMHVCVLILPIKPLKKFLPISNITNTTTCTQCACKQMSTCNAMHVHVNYLYTASTLTLAIKLTVLWSRDPRSPVRVWSHWTTVAWRCSWPTYRTSSWVAGPPRDETRKTCQWSAQPIGRELGGWTWDPSRQRGASRTLTPPLWIGCQLGEERGWTQCVYMYIVHV